MTTSDETSASGAQLPLNPQHFGTFLAVVDAGGRLSAAARELGLSQPGVTHQLNELEKRLGTRLLDRQRGRPARVTRAGRVFERYARSIVGMQSALYADLDQLSRNISGHVRVGASHGVADTWLAPLLCSFRDQHPGVHVEMNVADSTTIAEQITDGVYELGFVGARSSSSALQFDPVRDVRPCIIAPADHPRAQTGDLKLADLVGERIVAPRRGMALRALFDHELARHELPLARFDVVAELGSHGAIRRAVEAGVGLAPAWRDEGAAAVGAASRDEGARAVELDVIDLSAESRHYLVRKATRRLSRRGQALADHVRRARDAHQLEATAGER